MTDEKRPGLPVLDAEFEVVKPRRDWFGRALDSFHPPMPTPYDPAQPKGRQVWVQVTEIIGAAIAFIVIVRLMMNTTGDLHDILRAAGVAALGGGGLAVWSLVLALRGRRGPRARP